MNERTDRELLELAARASGYEIAQAQQRNRDNLGYGHVGLWIKGGSTCWNPLDNDGYALRMAVELNMDMRYESCADGVSVTVGGAWDDAPEPVHEIFERDGLRATRRAIVRAAAAMAEGGER